MRTIVWFRGKDLRLTDHAPLAEAVRSGGEVIPLFVLDPYFFAPERAQKIANRMHFLVGSLTSLAENLAHRGSRLVVVTGRSVEVVPKLADTLGADRVLAQRWVEPFARERDRLIQTALGDRFTLFEGETILTPGTVRTQTGGVYSVYSPFARAAKARLAEPQQVLSVPERLPPVPDVPEGLEVPLPTSESLGLRPSAALPAAGERAARERMKTFLRDGLATYGDQRDLLAVAGTSHLSQDLKFGTLSVRELYARAGARLQELAAPQQKNAQRYLDELLWREFAHHTLWDRPNLLERPFRADFEGFPWGNDAAKLEAWKQGRTGYPVVDAAARQLLGTGWVHNRARMIAASFLTKHLDVSYQLGEQHYLDLLVDGDWAQNNLGWQWSAGCGCDAQPYFRIFNPMSQGKKFDPEGDYVRRWVPELAKLPEKFIHEPWMAPADVLSRAGVKLGANYPRPIVDHATARQAFLDRAARHLGRPVESPVDG